MCLGRVSLLVPSFPFSFVASADQFCLPLQFPVRLVMLLLSSSKMNSINRMRKSFERRYVFRRRDFPRSVSLTIEVRSQVDRLQSLVDSLTASPKSVKPSLRSAYGVSDSTDGPPSDLLPTFDLLAHDLTQALVELAFETVLPRQRVGELSFSPRGQNGDTFLEEARQYCQSRSKPSPLVPISLITPSSSSSEASPSSSAFPSHRPNALTTSSFLLRRQSNGGSFLDSLPSTHEMMLASNHYFSIYESSSFVVHHSSYEQQRERLKRGVEDNVELDPSSASIVVAIAAAGLSRMSDRQYKEMGLSGDRTSNVKQWLDVALSALSFAQVRSFSLFHSFPITDVDFDPFLQFPERPTLDGIRTCLVVASVQLVRRDLLLISH